MTRRPSWVISAAAVLAVLAMLAGCATIPLPAPLPLPLPVPLPAGPGAPQTLPPDAPLEAGGCFLALTQRSADTDDRVVCTRPHYADVVGMLEWPGMDELVDAEGARIVWDELSGNYGPRGLADAFDTWARGACGAAFRELIGWDALQVEGRHADELGLLPGGYFTVVPALADAATFLDGDHRVRCAADWRYPVSYPRGITIADIADTAFPQRTRECYLADPAGDLEWVRCDRRHTDQSLLVFDALGVFDADFVRRIAAEDEGAFADASRFCSDAIVAAWGPWRDTRLVVWSTWFASADWEVLGDRAPDPEGYYPFGCLLSTPAGQTRSTDLLAER